MKAVATGDYWSDFVVLFQLGRLCLPPMIAHDQGDAEALTLKEVISELDETERYHMEEILKLEPGVWTKTIVSFGALAREAERRIKEAGLG